MKDNTGFMIVMCIVVLFFMFVYQASGGEWNDKPVMCEQKEIVLDTIKSKGELPLITGIQSTKVRDIDGLSDIPAHTALQIFVNHQTKTFSILEYHPSYNSICIIAYGDDWKTVGEKL